MHVPLGWHLYGLSGPRIAAHTSDPDLAEKTAEPAQLHPVPWLRVSVISSSMVSKAFFAASAVR